MSAPAANSATCSGPECDRPVFRWGLCHGHAKQRQRGRPIRPLVPRWQEPQERLQEAAMVYADAKQRRSPRAEALRDAAVNYGAARKLLDAAEAYAGADADAEYQRAVDRLKSAARAYVLGKPVCATPGCGRRRYRGELCFACNRALPLGPPDRVHNS